MNRSEASRTLVMRPARGAAGMESSVSAKLAMAEFLLVAEDMAECAQRAVQWLGRHSGVRKALCLAVDPSQKQLITLASMGLDAGEPEEITLDLSDGQHPLIAALFKSRLVVLRGSPANPRAATPPYGPDAFAAIPMGGGDASDER